MHVFLKASVNSHFQRLLMFRRAVLWPNTEAVFWDPCATFIFLAKPKSVAGILCALLWCFLRPQPQLERVNSQARFESATGMFKLTWETETRVDQIVYFLNISAARLAWFFACFIQFKKSKPWWFIGNVLHMCWFSSLCYLNELWASIF